MSPQVLRDEVPLRIVLVRHGRTPWSVSGRHTGRTDIPLDEVGELDAKALQSRIADFEISRSYCSPLQRAQKTAELAGIPSPVLLDDLLEWDYGDYEGRTTPEIQEDVADWFLWRDGCPNGESADDVALRADRVIATITQLAEPGEVVAVVGHGHMLRELGARWLGLSAKQGGKFVLDTASISVLGYEHGTPVFLHWNT